MRELIIRTAKIPLICKICKHKIELKEKYVRVAYANYCCACGKRLIQTVIKMKKKSIAREKSKILVYERNIEKIMPIDILRCRLAK